MRRAHWFSTLLFVAAVGAGGCITAGEMHPGERCGSCHSGSDAPAFAAAGTVYSDPRASPRDGIEGATVDVTDADGRKVSLQSNGLGNFYSQEKLRPPLQVTISKGGVRRSMSDASSGDCNSCHTAGTNGPGRVYLR
jgi:hypothetical protein